MSAAIWTGFHLTVAAVQLSTFAVQLVVLRRSKRLAGRMDALLTPPPPAAPFVVFMAGAKGSGKSSYVYLDRAGRPPIEPGDPQVPRTTRWR